MEISFGAEDDFGTEAHRTLRTTMWMGGSHTELPYLLSCLTRLNYLRFPCEVWEPKVRELVSERLPEARWTLNSTYFYEFSVLLLRELYRRDDLGERFPIQAETRQDAATRYTICNITLSLDELATELKTTVKQLERNATLKLARQEYERSQS